MLQHYLYRFFHKSVSVAILLAITYNHTTAQSSRLFTTDDALPNTLVNDVIEDANSMIWVATEFGLCRYDGSKFTTYLYEKGNPNSLQNNYVRSLFVDNEGRLLVGSRRGLQVYRPATDDFSTVATFEGTCFESGDISCIIQRRNGEIWMSGNVPCCARIMPDGTPVLYANALTGHITNTETLAEDSAGRLWTNRRIRELYCLEPDGNLIHCKQDDKDIPLNTLYQAHDGNLYAGGLWPGLYRYDPSAKRFDLIDAGKGNSFLVRSICNLDADRLLVATDNVGLKIYDCRTGRIQDYDVNDGRIDLSSQKVHAICMDSHRAMWLALYQKGVMMVPQHPQPFHFLGAQSATHNSIGDKCVTSIIHDSDNNIWVATDNGGLFQLDPDGRQLRHFPYTGLPNSVPSSFMRIYEDSRHRFWYGSYAQGYGWIDPQTGRCTPLAIDGRSSDFTSVYDFAEDSEGHIWVATMGNGLFRFDESRRTLVQPFDYDSCRWAGCIHFDAGRKRLYVGSFNGLSEISTDQTPQHIRQHLKKYIIFAICPYTSGRLALCTTEGLIIFNPDDSSYVAYTTDDGLPSDFIYAAQCDADGRLWISTNAGLVCYDENRHNFNIYTIHDGLQSNEFYKNASMKDKDGRLWFGGTSGISYFQPQQVDLEGEQCTARIVDVMAGGQLVHNRNQRTFDNNTISFEMATVPLYRTQHVIYRYSLDDDPWIELPQGQNRITFSQIASGPHKFRYSVQLAGQESEGVTYTFAVAYPWYRQWWSMLLFMLLLFAAAYMVYVQIRHRRAVKKRLAQHIQNQAINEAKLQFFMNIAHEIRTPMTMIVSPLQKLLSADTDPDRRHAYLMMQRNADRIVGTINQLMDLRKIDKKQMTLYCSEVEIARYVNELFESMRDVADVRLINLTLRDLTEPGLHLWVDTSNFDKILINLLSNALKYTPAKGSVEVCIQQASATKDFPEGRFVMSVTDTGEGIPNDEKRRVFERFYQVRSTASGKGGTGIGLHLTSSLVRLHHGTISVTDNPAGHGTCFTVTLPLGCAHLKSNEKAEQPVVATSASQVNAAAISPDAYVDDSVPVAEKTQSRHSVLVVEDDDEIRQYIVQELSAYCRVQQCPNGREALAAIMNQAPDLIISDVMMPEMDGFELCRKVRANVRFNHIPIVLLTAKSDEESRLESLDLGADAFLTKPFSMEVLRHTVQNLLKTRAALRNTFSGQQMPVEQITTPDAKTPDERLMERILKVINQHLSDPGLTTEAIASEVGMSRVHLYRKLKELTNQSARDFIRNIRLAKAAEMLSQKKCSVTEVSDLVGFSNASNFSTCFKDVYGASPMAYMEAHNNKAKEQ